MTHTLMLSTTARHAAALIALVIVLVAGIGAGAALPPAVDWDTVLRPAVRAMAGGDRSFQAGFYYPPWAAIPLIPLALLPVAAGRGLLFVGTLLIYGAAALKCGAQPLGAVAVVLSPVALHEYLNGNIDALVLLALFVPPRWGLLFAVIKPQVGAGLVAFWAVEAWRERTLVQTFAPLVLVTLASFALYGFWPLHARAARTYWWNASLWPYGLPLAGVLLAGALWRRDERPALAAGAFAAPYVLFHSYIGALVALSGHRKSILVTAGLLWALSVWRWWGG